MQKRQTRMTQARAIADSLETTFNRRGAAHVMVTAHRKQKGYGAAHVTLDHPTVAIVIGADRKPVLTKVSPRHRQRALTALGIEEPAALREAGN